MLYLIYGNDTYKARKKLHELLDKAGKKRPEAEIFKLTTENWSEGQFEELLASRGLFEQKYTVVLDNLFARKEIKDYVVEKLKDLKDSEQIFLALESKIDAETLKKIKSSAEQVQEFTKTESKKEELNIFSITEGLLEKDKKHLWISYIDLLGKGAVAEEIHGILFWQVKNMILVSRAGSLAETGLSPYIYKSSLTGSRKYKTEELSQMSGELVNMTHKVRQGEGELDLMLEKWILRL